MDISNHVTTSAVPDFETTLVAGTGSAGLQVEKSTFSWNDLDRWGWDPKKLMQNGFAWGKDGKRMVWVTVNLE